MTLTDVLSKISEKQLKRALKSYKEYLIFDISVFNVGMYVHIKCTNKFTQFGRNWNGYDFILDNDKTMNFYIKQELKNRTENENN